MADVTSTSGWPKMLNIGSVNMWIYRITDVDDAETLDTKLGTNIIDYWVSWNGNPGTQASAGGHSTRSNGVITFYPSSDNLDASVFVIAHQG